MDRREGIGKAIKMKKDGKGMEEGKRNDRRGDRESRERIGRRMKKNERRI